MSSYVQANSVQTQFATLSRDRDNLIRQKEQANGEHQRTQVRIKQLKGRQTDLIQQIRSIQEELGTLNRKKTLLNQEKGRVNRNLQSERKGLEDCALHTQSLEQEETNRTKTYCKEIGVLNDEIANLLHGQFETKIEALLSVESVNAVLMDKLPESISQEDFLEKLALMQEAKEKYEMTIDRYKNKIQAGPETTEGREGELQSAEMTTNPNDIDETVATAPQNHNDNGSKQMDLFYGSDSNHSTEKENSDSMLM